MKQEGCARVFIVQDIKSILKIMMTTIQSLKPEKRALKEKYFQSQAKTLFLPNSVQNNTNPNSIGDPPSEKADIASIYVVKAFQTWAADYLGISIVEANILMKALGSLRKIISADEATLAQVPVSESCRQKVFHFFASEISEDEEELEIGGVHNLPGQKSQRQHYNQEMFTNSEVGFVSQDCKQIEQDHHQDMFPKPMQIAPSQHFEQKHKEQDYHQEFTNSRVGIAPTRTSHIYQQQSRKDEHQDSFTNSLVAERYDRDGTLRNSEYGNDYNNMKREYANAYSKNYHHLPQNTQHSMENQMNRVQNVSAYPPPLHQQVVTSQRSSNNFSSFTPKYNGISHQEIQLSSTTNADGITQHAAQQHSFIENGKRRFLTMTQVSLEEGRLQDGEPTRLFATTASNNNPNPPSWQHTIQQHHTGEPDGANSSNHYRVNHSKHRHFLTPHQNGNQPYFY